MAIAFRAVGARSTAASGNMAAVALPTGHTTNDILILFTVQEDTVNSTVSGWTNKLNTTVTLSTSNLRLQAWWLRDNGAVSAPTVTHTAGGVSIAWIGAYSGVDSGLADPFRDAQTQSAASLNTTTVTGPALTGVVAGDMRIFAGGFTANDTSGLATNNWSTVTGFTERADYCSALTGAWSTSGGYDDLVAVGSAGSVTSTCNGGGFTFTTGIWIGAQLALSSAVSGAVAAIPDIAMGLSVT